VEGAEHAGSAAALEWKYTMRTFTLREAQSMLPILESLLRKSIEAKAAIEEIDQQFQELGERIFLNGGMLVDVRACALRKAKREKAIQSAKDTLSEINAIGVQVKDLDIGLLDFPCKVNGEIVLLCWRMGEPTISHWHGTEEGYAGRRPIDDRMSGQ
jgi:hypothetical protein